MSLHTCEKLNIFNNQHCFSTVFVCLCMCLFLVVYSLHAVADECQQLVRNGFEFV